MSFGLSGLPKFKSSNYRLNPNNSKYYYILKTSPSKILAAAAGIDAFCEAGTLVGRAANGSTYA